jgi:osmotically-inducible protein OsmY
MTGTVTNFHFANRQSERIREDVIRQITWQQDLYSNDIQVTVRDSTVFLTGSVLSCLERREAEKAAKAPFAVTHVVNLLLVDPKCRRADSEIIKDLQAALLNVSSVPDEVPQFAVRNGNVTLRGNVPWHFERQRAENIALAVLGVVSVKNLITVGDPTAARAFHASLPREGTGLDTGRKFELQAAS